MTWKGVAAGLAPRYSAATPATCGVAMEVPLQVPVEVSESSVEEVIADPGANRSRQVP